MLIKIHLLFFIHNEDVIDIKLVHKDRLKLTR